MKTFKDTSRMFRFNLLNTVIYEIIYLVAACGVIVPLYYFIVNSSIKAAGLKYLSKANAKSYFTSPFTYLFLLLGLILIGLIISLNIFSLSASYDRANRVKKTNPFIMIGRGFKHTIRILKPSNMLMIPFIVFFAPVMGILYLILMFLHIRGPLLAVTLSLDSKVVITILLILLVLLFVLSLNFMFVFQIFFKEKLGFIDSIKRNNEIIKGNRVDCFIGMIMWILMLVVIPYVISRYYSGPFLESFFDQFGFKETARFVFDSMSMVATVMYSILSLPFLMAFITNKYYDLVPEDASIPNIDDEDVFDSKKTGRNLRITVLLVLFLTIGANVTFYVLREMQIINLYSGYMDKVTITAHRGDCKHAPENTLAAFEAAIENGADVIELDVRQTKDGEIVVMHDESIKRTCGKNKKVGKLTYEELLEYHPTKGYKGSNKADFAEEKIPTLREAIELVGDRAEMNIELKPSKTDVNLEEKVAELIAEYDYYDNCVVTSLEYKSIKKIKKIDPDIKTVYVMAVAMGDFYNLQNADAYSIKYRYINTEVVTNAHEKKKDVYAWTVDDPSVLEEMMILNVDSIITNDPKGMRKAMYDSYYEDNLFDRVTGFFSGLM